MAEQGLSDRIMLTRKAVESMIPSYASDEDVQNALEQSMMRVKDIYAEAEFLLEGRRVDDNTLANVYLQVIYSKFTDKLESITAHKAALRPS